MPTLSDASLTIDLPDALLWTDQHDWSPVVQAVSTSLTGATLIDVGVHQAGRPITLTGSENHAWLHYSVLNHLKSFAGTPLKTMTLLLQGMSFQVIFRHHDAPALEMHPLIDFSAPDADDWFYGTIKLMTVN